ncbi:tRNA-dihydrouridine synthase [bacterium]|nr:tRNA-dihydrouridine synthase [bacterium]
MAGITSSPFRRLCRSYGAGLLYTECISAEGVRRQGERSLVLADFHPDERPIAVQLFGHDPQQFHNASAIIAERYKPDMIDINCGCPVKRMTKRGNGGSLMKSPDLIGRIIEAAIKGSGLPVSVKLRSGYYPSEETAPEAASIAEDAGASLIAIHGRYVKHGFKSAVDLDVIGRVKTAVKRTPIVGNGDIKSTHDAEMMMKQTGCDRVMIGRAAFGRPWIFKTSGDTEFTESEPSDTEKIDILLEHYRQMLDYFPEKSAVPKMRKHIGRYTRGMRESSKLRVEAMKLSNAGDVIGLIKEFMKTI